MAKVRLGYDGVRISVTLVLLSVCHTVVLNVISVTFLSPLNVLWLVVADSSHSAVMKIDRSKLKKSTFDVVSIYQDY